MFSAACSTTLRYSSSLSEFLLRLLSLGDVEHEALPAEGMTIFVAHEHRLVAQPDHTTVPGEHPVLQGERVPGLAGTPVLGKHPPPVVGMQHLRPVVGIGRHLLW